jgi:hypothetical protein
MHKAQVTIQFGRDRERERDRRPNAEDGWVLLGEQRVNFFVDRDVVRVGRREGRFDALALRVKRNDIELISMRVVYGNGSSEELAYRERLREGERTRPIELRGEGRFIQEIQFVYRSRPSFQGEAILEVYGREAEGRGAGGGRDDDDFFNREGKRASCDTYAQIAVVQSEAASKYRCGLRGPEWSANARDHYQWCLRAPRQRLLADVRSRYEALGNCFNRLGDDDYETWRGRR